MKTLVRILLSGGFAALALASLAGSANAAFGLKEFDVTFSPSGAQAGSHPSAQTVELAFNTVGSGEEEAPDGNVKDQTVFLPPGFVGDPTVVTPCSNVDFVVEACSASSQVGTVDANVFSPEKVLEDLPVYSIDPPPGAVIKLGFTAITVPVTLDVKLNPNPPYNAIGTLRNTANAIPIFGAQLSVFGTPPGSPKPFLTLPRACEGPLFSTYEATSWEQPDASTSGAAATPFEATDCESLEFGPTISAEPSTSAAETPSGLDFDLTVDDPGLTELAPARADSDIEKAVVTLPQGMTTNPSIASGLQACSLAQYNTEALESTAGGCPEASKVGSVQVTTPLLDETLGGSIYVARQGDNPFNSLLALYIVIREPELGILVKQATKIEPDPLSGQLRSTVDAIPQLPFSNFHLHFRSGPRAPLITPATCGTYAIEADLYPYANPVAPVHRTASFEVSSGAGGAPCAASLSQLPHSPSFSAGTLSPLAGAYSPFVFRLARNDGSQQLAAVTTILPKGLVGRLAGIPYCPEAQIAAAKARSALGQGALELAQPSCSPASAIGAVTAASGAGPDPYYISGKAYLAGPYKGAPLSVLIITPALAGPFDLGVVAVRTALYLDPETARIDAVSDPIPTILHGLPLDVRSVALEMNRPDFTLNPTSCEASAVTGTATSTLGAVAPLSSYFQAASCGRLGFKPKLSLELAGGTRRSDHPALRSVLVARPGDANIAKATVKLPATQFIDNARIQNPCTRVQFNAGACPKGSILGTAKAVSPLLDAPLQGPVYFRSNGGERLLPDIVADLQGQIHVVVVGWVDSVDARIRTRFVTVPDAPVSKFTLQLKGGKKGLLVNSRNLCKEDLRADVKLTGQNAKAFDTRAEIKTSCKSKGKAKRR